MKAAAATAFGDMPTAFTGCALPDLGVKAGESTFKDFLDLIAINILVGATIYRSTHMLRPSEPREAKS